MNRSAVYVTFACTVPSFLFLDWAVLMLHIIKECRHQIISKSVMMPEAVRFLFTTALKMLKNKEQPRPWRPRPIYSHRPVEWLNGVSSKREWSYPSSCLVLQGSFQPVKVCD